MTMTLVSTVEVGAGGAASIDFTSIPQTGTDLLLVVSARTGNSSVYDNLRVQFNGDTNTANYSARYLDGSGSAATSDVATDVQGITEGNTATASTFGNASIYIPNYTSAVAKSVNSDSVSENNATAARQRISAGLWSGTAAITSIALKANSGTNFAQYSTASLYVIQKGSGGASVS